MDTATVIKMLTILKAGKNFPLRMTTTDHATTIDESKAFQFTKWDDTNEILYSFRLVNMIDSISGSNRDQSMSVMAIAYADITSMEIVNLPLSKLEDVFESLDSNGCQMNDDFKNLIKHTFESALHPGRYQLPPTLIKEMLGKGSVNDNDDYYAGKFVPSSK